MDVKCRSKLEELSWYRLTASFVVVRRIQMAKAHIFTMIQAIVKRLDAAQGNPLDGQVFFHLREVNHSIKVEQGSHFTVDFLFTNIPQSRVSLWRDDLRTLLSDPIEGQNLNLLELGDVEERSYRLLIESPGARIDTDELCLDFLSPYPFRRTDGKPRTWISL